MGVLAHTPRTFTKDEDINDTYFSLNPTGSNYYALDEWTTGQQVKLKTNPNSVHGRPLLEKGNQNHS